MNLHGLVSAALARFVIPLRAAAPGTPYIGELWQIAAQIYFRNAADTATLRLLNSAELGVAGGVASLGADGLVPSAQLPSVLSSAFFVPIGGCFEFAGDPSAIPAGCLVRDGAEYLRAEYPLLAAALRCKYGRPSTDEYFRVPDSIQKVSYGAWGYPNSGMVRRVDVVLRGQGYTPGTYAFTFTGGSFSAAATGIVTVVNENVPGVGVTGVIDHIDIVTPGSYTSLGAASAGTAANCALTIPGAAVPGGSGFSYDIFAQPIAAVRAPYAWSVRMTNHGTGYTTPPQVSFSGGSLKGATAYAIVRDGGVAEVVITNPGSGSTAGVTITFTGGGGASAAASIYLDLSYMLPGDYIGSEAHLPLVSEMAAHTHDFQMENATGDSSGRPEVSDPAGSYVGTTESTGGAYPMAMHPAGVGLIPLIRAV